MSDTPTLMPDCPLCRLETEHERFWDAAGLIANKYGKTLEQIVKEYLDEFHANGHPSLRYHLGEEV